MRKVIALSGEMKAGKDVFAEALFIRGFQRGSFAENLKEMCKQVFQLTSFMVDTQEGKGKRLQTPRRINQKTFLLIRRWMAKTHDLQGIATAVAEIEEEFIHKPTRQLVSRKRCGQLEKSYRSWGRTFVDD